MPNREEMKRISSIFQYEVYLENNFEFPFVKDLDKFNLATAQLGVSQFKVMTMMPSTKKIVACVVSDQKWHESYHLNTFTKV